MVRTRSRALTLHASILLTSLLATSHVAIAQIKVPDGMGVGFTQNNYIDTDTNTGTVLTVFGTANVNAASLSLLGLSSGYINVSDTSGRWLVRNLEISSTVGNSATSFTYNISPGTVVSNAQLSVNYSMDPIPDYNPSIPEYQPYNPYDVRPQPGQFCGRSSVIPGGGLPAIIFGGLNVAPVMRAVPNIQSADQQCVPAAFDNAMIYMAQFGTNVPDPSFPGRYGATSAVNAVKNYFIPTGPNTPVVQTEGVSAIPMMVGQLDKTMSRTNVTRAPSFVAGGNRNQGVAIKEQLEGITDYISMTNNAGKIGILTQGVDTNLAFNNHGVTVTMFNSTPTWDFIKAALDAGDVVEGNYGFAGGGGHAVNIVGAGKTLGVPWIRYTSDWAQTGVLDPLDTKLVANPADMIVHRSLVLSSGDTVGTDGLWLFGEASRNGVPILQNVTVLYRIPEPSSAMVCLLVTSLAAVRRRRR